jgi:hypothetical protein
MRGSGGFFKKGGAGSIRDGMADAAFSEHQKTEKKRRIVWRFSLQADTL